MSCSTTKYVGENQYLLDKVKITSDSSIVKVGNIKSYLRQQPNYKVFGLLKWPLYVYNWSGQNEKNWLNKQLRRVGEEPEIMDTTLVEQSCNEFERYMINKGYLYAEITANIDTSVRKKAVVNYHIIPNEPFHIRQYQTIIDDSRIDSIVHLQAPKMSWIKTLFRSTPEEYTPLVHEGDLFDRDILNKERQRMTTLLRRRGYYAFNSEYINFVADSAFNRNLVDLDMVVKPFRYTGADGVMEERAHKPYYINHVSIVTDYDPLNMSGKALTPVDSVLKRDLWIYYEKKGRSIHPGVLEDRNFIVPGRLYNERHIEQTYSSFSALTALRHVNIRYDEFEENDTLKLNCTILTAPAKTQGVGVEVE
ncbi:MAG: hypothetical protein LBN71_01205, partial [Tannerella sp.]|nr:hypothetical protein [Tannerella sp.]